MNYKVGQIVYLLSRKDIKIFPAQVIEEIRRKTLDKEIISYILRLPNKDRSEVLLDEINADVFTSLEDVDSKMKKNAHEQINGFLKRAKDMESIFNPPDLDTEDKEKERSSTEDHQLVSHENNDKSLAEVDLGNGMKGKINLSELPV